MKRIGELSHAKQGSKNFTGIRGIKQFYLGKIAFQNIHLYSYWSLGYVRVASC